MSDVKLPRMLTPQDVQRHLGINKNKTYALIKRKGFPRIMIGSRYLIPEDEYMKWIRKNLGNEIFI